MQLLVQVYLADYIKAYFGLSLGLVTSGLGLGVGTFLPRPQAFGLGLELSIFFDPFSFAMTTSSSLPKAW